MGLIGWNSSIENVGDKAILSKLFIPITTKSDTFLLSIVLLLACMVDRARLTGAPEISNDLHVSSRTKGGGRVVRWSLVNFKCRDVIQFDIVGQGPVVLAVGAVGVVWAFLLSSILSLLFLPLFGRRLDLD